ncbi:sugar-binding protein [Capnocytophaga sp. oral taxon 338]|jgi:hypothetical protein|uniref:sugar-binding protein n=1 Tax=Capnocytophaga sp. oral taxon 338 TaxID=710239 RepID=UPI000E44B2D2|nr:sugar-binding protein [Capnocytophaga sp. oral taxon 338]
MRLLFYIIISLFLFSCTSTPQKPVAKKPNPHLKNENLQGSIKTQSFINYIFIEDSLTRETKQILDYQISLTYDEQGYEIENLYQNDSLQEYITAYYDKNHRKISENYIHKFLKNNIVKRTLTNYVYDTLGYETTRMKYDFSDSLNVIHKFDTEYDKNGNIANITEYVYNEGSWQLSDRIVYKYNSKGYEIEKESYYYYMALWLLKNKEVSKYKQDSLLIEKLFYNYKKSNIPDRILYSYNDLQKDITYINTKDSITSMESYLYNKQGDITNYTEYTPQGLEKQRIFYLYTPYGEDLEDIVYKDNSEQERTIYRYDAKGNLTKKITYQGNKVKYLTEVKYTYYQATPNSK